MVEIYTSAAKWCVGVEVNYIGESNNKYGFRYCHH